MGDDTNHQEISGMPSLPSPKPFQMCRHGSSRWLRAAPAAPALSARAARRATWGHSVVLLSRFARKMKGLVNQAGSDGGFGSSAGPSWVVTLVSTELTMDSSLCMFMMMIVRS